MNAHLPEKIVHEIRTQHVLNRFNTADQAARFIVHLTTMEHVSGQVFQLDSRISRAL
jgi:3-oxoacyl-[acyl-carrier protein] reductase